MIREAKTEFITDRPSSLLPATYSHLGLSGQNVRDMVAMMHAGMGAAKIILQSPSNIEAAQIE